MYTYIQKLDLTSNKLKIIAILSMIIDHIGYYFYFTMSENIYVYLRIIGRLAMPIFVFLLVQGFLKTSNKAKYITRIFILAVITQMAIWIVYLLNIYFIPDYHVEVYNVLNILFSFVLSLCILSIIQNKINLSSAKKDSKLDKTQNNIQKEVYIPAKNKYNIMLQIFRYLLYLLLIISIGMIYYLIDIDYGVLVPLLTVLMYANEKINKVEDKIGKYINKITLTVMIIFIGLLQEVLVCKYLILSLIPILLYNGKLGKKSNNLKGIFYFIFPLQHIILYICALVMYKSIF